MMCSSFNAWLQVAGGAFFISLAAPLVKATSVDPTVSAIYRMVFGALALGLLLLLRSDWRRGLHQGWLGSSLIALFFALDLWFWHRSIHWLGPGLSTLLANFQVFLLPLAGRMLYGEQPHARFFYGLLMAAAGLWLLFGLSWSVFDEANRLGILYGLLTAVAYTAYTLTLRHQQSKAYAPAAMARLFQVSVLCAVLLVVMRWAEKDEGLYYFLIGPKDFGFLLAYGVLCQVAGWLLITRGLPLVTTAVAGLLLLLQPSMSLLWDALFYGLQLTHWQIAGVGMALVGIYLGTVSRRNANAEVASSSHSSKCTRDK